MVGNNQENTKIYTVNIDENGMLESVLVEEGRFGRWLYKRAPKDMELHLTEDVFEEAVYATLDNGGICAADKLYKALRVTDEHYANLMLKAYKAYIRLYVLGANLHQDAFWG